MSRVVVQFSCGAASAVAAKLTLAKHPEAIIVNAFIKEEHPDNRRFLVDCEHWFERKVTVLRDEKYGASTVEVFKRKQFIKGPRGAPCSRILKRELLARFMVAGDVMVLGFTAEEVQRLEDFTERYSGPVMAPLIDRGLGKEDCKAMVERAGLVLPVMYRLGYDNANCIGCVKGGQGYWRAIREDFPSQFAEMADIEETIGPGAFLFYDRNSGERFSLRQLGDGAVRRGDPLPSCSFFCELAEQEYTA